MTDEENIEQDNCSLETTARIVAEPVSCINNEPVTAFPVAQSYIFNINDRHNQVQERNLETIRECGEILEVRINDNRQREEVLARHSQIDLDRYQNFPKFFFTRTKFYVITLFCLNIIAINVSFAAAGAAMLRVNNISYHVNEATTVAFFGASLLCPLAIYLERLFYSKNNRSGTYKCLAYFRRVAVPILIPIIGYQVLEQARGVEMQIGQHLTAYALGSLTLFLPYAFLTTYMIKYYNKGCLNIERELYTIRPISITQTTVTSSPERTQTNALYSDAAEISSHNIEESKRPIILTH